MGLFKLRKNKKFSYTPRYYKGDGNPYALKHKFDYKRTTIEKNNFKKTVDIALNDLKSFDLNSLKIIFGITFFLLLIFLFIIDFDLTIFI